MNERQSLEVLKGAEELANQLSEEVKAAEGTLSAGAKVFRSAGTKLGPGAEALQQLRETRLSFGNPYHNLTRLTPERLEECGIELPVIQKLQMKERFDFYFMTLPVSMQPGRGVQFTRLECLLDFGPKGQDEPIVHSIFPQGEWQEVLRLGRKMNLGLDGNLEWKAGLEFTNSALPANLPASIRGKVSNINEFKAYITIPEFSYELGKTGIAATGAGNSQCFWRIDKPELKKVQTVQFGVVFKVPRGKSVIELTGIVSVEPSFQWLTGNLKDVFDCLSERLKGLLRLKDEERRGMDRLPMGDHEKWEITLPVLL